MLSAVLSVVLLAPVQNGDDALLTKALKEGVVVNGGKRFKLPQPFMKLGATPAEKKKVLAQFIDEEGERFIDSSGPHFFKAEEQSDNSGLARTVSVAFVAHGKLADLEKKGLVDQLLGLNKKAKTPVELTADELKARKITLQGGKTLEERFTKLEANLDDRVEVTGVMRNQSYRGQKGQMTGVGLLDDRFKNDKESPNRYRKLQAGTPVGEAQPYSGFGGYVRATELEEPEGALFIEMHFIYSEPKDWFGGKNLLVPKFRLAVKNNIVTVRKSLKNPMK